MGLIPFSKKRLNYFGSCYCNRQNLLRHAIINIDISEEIAKEMIMCAECESLRDDNV
jgi:uncharacterized CHY-type Zn-finger protein